MNLYGFAGGDPINFSDPMGLCPIVLAAAGPAGVAAAGALCLGEIVMLAFAASSTIHTFMGRDRTLIPTQGGRPSREERDAVNELGELEGCMTCGATSPG